MLSGMPDSYSDNRRYRSRWVWAVLAVLMSASGFVIGAAPALASTACTSRTKHYGLSDGSISTRVAWVEMHVELCTDGTVITSATAASSSDSTGPGSAFGFDVSFKIPYRTSFQSGGRVKAGEFGYTSKGRLRDCIPYTTVLCSDSENFKVHVHVAMYRSPAHVPYRLPPGKGWFSFKGRWFKVSWTHACTNKVCGVRFH